MSIEIHNKTAEDIESKLSLSYGLFVLFLLATILLATLLYFKTIITDEQKRLSSVIASSVGESINKVSFSGKYQARLLIENLVKENPNIHSIIIQEKDGKVIAHSERKYNDSFLRDNYFERALASANQAMVLIQNTKYEAKGKKIDLIEIDMPYLKGHKQEIAGVIRISLTTDILGSFLNSGVLFFVLLIVALTLFSIIVLRRISNRVSAPIRQLAFWLEGILAHAPMHMYISSREKILVKSKQYPNISYFVEGSQNRSIEESIFDDGEHRSFDFSIGKKFYHATKYPIAKDKSGVQEVCTIALDITDRRKAQDELVAINKNLEKMVEEETARRIEAEQMALQRSKMALMGEMMGAIAHQWRQPLNALAITIQDIEDAKSHNELTDEYIKQIVENSMTQINFMSKTIDDFRSFFLPSKDKLHFELQKPVNDAIAIVDKQLKNHSITIETKIDPSLTVYGYKNELQQVILNLLGNAKDAIVDRFSKIRKIKIEAVVSKDNILLITEDSGGGIEQSVLDRIAEPYFTTKEQGKGTGVGLYMSKQIIERHMRGDMIFENGANGAKVTIVLPIEEQNKGKK